MLHSICQQIWTTQQWSQDWKKSVFIPIPKKGNTKECSNYHTIALISHASKLMLKILQARLQQYMNSELPDVQAGFRKGRVLGASVRSSARGKGHEEEARHTQRWDRASGVPLDILDHLPPKTRVCLLYCFVLSPLTLWGLSPTTISLSLKKS